MAHRFQFHPRDVDRLRCSEFDVFAGQIDLWIADEERQEREQRTAAARR